MNKLRFIIISIMLFLNFSFFEDILANQKNSENTSQIEKFILVIINSSDLYCSICNDSLIEFNEFLLSKVLNKSRIFVVGILLYKCPPNKKEYERCEKIIKKQLRGFILTNNICFPIVLDKFHVFKEFNKEKSAIIYFDKLNGILKKYMFPLKSNQLEEIFSFTAKIQ